MADALIGDRLDVRADREFVGREAETATLLSMFEPAGPVAILLHGIGGIGKSALLAHFARLAQSRGCTVIALDGRQIEPTEAGFLKEMQAAAGGICDTLGTASQRLGSLPGPVVLTIDTYEVLRLLDTWLRQAFLPALPANIRVVLAGREPPASGWLTDPGWQGVFQAIHVGALAESTSLELLGQLGIGPSDARRLNRLTHGHPLALKLGAGMFRETHDIARAEDRVIDTLTRRYLDTVPDPGTRSIIEAVSVVRRVTQSVLEALVPERAPGDIFVRLRDLPFVESARDGLLLHDAVREAVASSLKAQNPKRYRALRHAAWRCLTAELEAANSADLWRYAADMLYLTENPVIREAFFPSDFQPLSVEPARPDSRDAILGIAKEHEGPDSAAEMARWWRAAPQGFHVVRDQTGGIVGFYLCFDARAAARTALAEHPVTALMLDHLIGNPLAAGQTALILRKWLSRSDGEAPSAVQAACWLDVKRTYIEMRKNLRRVYTSARDVEDYTAILPVLGFGFLEETARLDGRRHHAAVLDFGPGLVPGWMGGIVGAELGVTYASVLDTVARELVVGGRRTPLTVLEFKVMSYLVEREKQVAERDAMLEAVWGITYDGASNVVDVVIRSLRRKLGPAARSIETVRGIGYRFNPPLDGGEMGPG